MPTLERVTVNLGLAAVRALSNTVDLTGSNKTDIINKALVVFEFVTLIQTNNGSLYLRESPDGDLERLRLL